MIIDTVSIKSNQLVATNTYEMVLNVPNMPMIVPGQFINIKLDGLTLRRPISVCRVSASTLTIIYKTVGEGTKQLSRKLQGDLVNIMLPLGTGFKIHEDKDQVLLIAGGIGLPPLYEVAKAYRKQNIRVSVVAGFNTLSDVFYRSEFEQLGCTFIVATLDGSCDFKGNVIEAIHAYQLTNQFIYACGPIGMLQALECMFKKGYVSFEAHMACGYGVCNSCACKDAKNSQLSYRICKEGPVFEIGTVLLTC